MNKDLDLFAASFAEFKARQETLGEKSTTTLAALDANFKALDDVVNANTTQTTEHLKLVKILEQVKKEATENKALTPELVQRLDDYQHDLDEVKASLDAIKQKRAKTGSLFLAMMLGKVNVRLWKKGEIVAFKVCCIIIPASI